MEKDGNGSTASSPLPPVPMKKRGGAMSLFRAAMFAFRGKSSKKTHAIVDASAAVKTIVSGMRPLHQLDYQFHPPPPPPPALALDSYYDVLMPPPSPCSSNGMSRYASAEDLQALDTSEDNEEEANNNGEPNAIDMKAEEFIAMFYKQMKLQQSDLHEMIDEEATENQQSESHKMVEEEVATEENAKEATMLHIPDSTEKVEEKATTEETTC